MAAYEPAETLGPTELNALAADFAKAEVEGSAQKSNSKSLGWTSSEGWQNALTDLAGSIPLPPDNVPVISGHTAASSGAGAAIRPRDQEGLLFTFCTVPNVNTLMASGGFKQVRDSVQCSPDTLQVLQRKAIARVRQLWETQNDQTAANGGEWSVGAFAKGFQSALGAGAEECVGATMALSKCVVKLGVSPLNKRQSETVQLSFEGAGEWQVRVNHIPSKAPADAYELQINPRVFTISKGKPVDIEVTCAMQRPDMKLQELLVLEMGPKKKRTGQEAKKMVQLCRLLVFLGMSSSSSVFGIPHEDVALKQVDGAMVPAVLELLKAELFESGGLIQGVFRKAGEKNEINKIKAQLNSNTYIRQAPQAQVHCVANLIKIWFREMPKPILASLNPDDLINLKTKAQCVKLLERIPQPNHGLCIWCLDMLLEVVRREDMTKMSAKNCAIVMAPNFLAKPGPDGGMKSIMMLQKSVFWLQNVLEHRFASLQSVTHISAACRNTSV